MVKIQVLGTGCAKCQQLAANAEQAARTLGGEYTLEKVSDITQITSFGVMLTPALVVNGEVKASGNVPSPEEIAAMLR